MKKRVFVLLLCLLLLLSACSTAAPAPTEGSTGTAAPATVAPETTEPPAPATEAAEPEPAPLTDFRIEGVDIGAYRVVVPQDCDCFTYAAALNIVDYFQELLGVELAMTTDATPAQDYEILLGDTNRPQSNVDGLEAGEYALFWTENKLVLQGESYLVGGGFGALVQTYVEPMPPEGIIDVTDLPSEPIPTEFTFTAPCTSVILMIGDGMGHAQIEMALANGLPLFAAQALPHIGTAVTRSQSVLDGEARYTDSAAAATALATGCKTLNGMIGQLPDGTPVMNVRELAALQGAKTAVLTTDLITGATPSAFLCHAASRYDTEILQGQIDAFVTAGQVEYCAGSLGDELLTHTRMALGEISDTAFFLMLEEAYIDKLCHDANMAGAYRAVTRFNEAIAYAVEFTLCHPGTALIVTADHETGGLTPAQNIAEVADLLSAERLEQHRAMIEADIAAYGYAFTTYTAEETPHCTHTNADVPVFAIGRGTEIFHGVATENTDIPHFIASVFAQQPMEAPFGE